MVSLTGQFGAPSADELGNLVENFARGICTGRAAIPDFQPSYVTHPRPTPEEPKEPEEEERVPPEEEAFTTRAATICVCCGTYGFWLQPRKCGNCVFIQKSEPFQIPAFREPSPNSPVAPLSGKNRDSPACPRCSAPLAGKKVELCDICEVKGGRAEKKKDTRVIEKPATVATTKKGAWRTEAVGRGTPPRTVCVEWETWVGAPGSADRAWHLPTCSPFGKPPGQQQGRSTNPTARSSYSASDYPTFYQPASRETTSPILPPPPPTLPTANWVLWVDGAADSDPPLLPTTGRDAYGRRYDDIAEYVLLKSKPPGTPLWCLRGRLEAVLGLDPAEPPGRSELAPGGLLLSEAGHPRGVAVLLEGPVRAGRAADPLQLFPKGLRE